MAPAIQSKLIPYIVLRAIAIGGERVEPNSLVELGPVLGAELAAANKVRRVTEADLAEGQAQAEAADHSPQKPTEPAPVVRRAAKAKAAEAPKAEVPAEQAPLLPVQSPAAEAESAVDTPEADAPAA